MFRVYTYIYVYILIVYYNIEANIQSCRNTLELEDSTKHYSESNFMKHCLADAIQNV
jgi:hypothetical protein